jgi:hypothetical protein
MEFPGPFAVATGNRAGNLAFPRTMAPNRKPWPLRWIILLIIAFAVPYTYINLRFRKPGPSFRPYEDARERANMARAGYTRVTITADRPDERPLAPGAAISATPWAAVSAGAGGLPDDLRQSLAEPPVLPVSIGPVHAPSSSSSGQPYAVDFECTLSDSKFQLAGARVYAKGGSVYLVADFERLNGGLVARTRRNLIRATLPAGALAPGRYRFTLPGQGESKSWVVQVH